MNATPMDAADLVLLPRPRELTIDGAAVPADVLNAEPATSIDPHAGLQPQGYRLTVEAGRVRIVGHDAAGLYYGHQTLAQLRRHERVPALTVTDHPDFAVRGVMLDISRDRVPTMATLREVIDMLASWKINHLQLYTEHTFAYAGHEAVWKDASPITPAEARELDAYCRDRHIELCPNQNTFGHLHRWLIHEPYRQFAEAPEGWTSPSGEHRPEPFSLCPTDPRSLALIADLLGQLLPCFTSGRVNIGCDETWDIGQGRSRDAVEERGAGQVYLDFLRQILGLARDHGRQPMFWGDIILKHPELIAELPPETVALVWGYDDDDRFAEAAPQFARAGVEFWLCPGTSSWLSLAGRYRNAMGNIRGAAEQGLAHGASGLLMTDWGDHGHWQPWCVSLLPLAYAAAVSWSVEPNRDLDMERVGNARVFEDPPAILAGLMMELGDLNRLADVSNRPHHTPLHNLLRRPHEEGPRNPVDGVSVEGLTRCLDRLDEVERRLPAAQPADARVRSEVQWLVQALRYACRQGLARLKAGRVGVAKLPAETRTALDRELESLLPDFERLWLSRSRPGGLSDSVAKWRRNLSTVAK